MSNVTAPGSVEGNTPCSPIRTDVPLVEHAVTLNSRAKSTAVLFLRMTSTPFEKWRA
ncbi:hypothetical protein D3C86_2101330 [compost metagenome]